MTSVQVNLVYGLGVGRNYGVLNQACGEEISLIF